MRVAVRTGLGGTWVPGVHANCMHNEYAALCLRALCPFPRPADPGLGSDFVRVFRHMVRVGSRYGGSRWTHLEAAESYSGSLRRRYLEAERSLRVDGPVGAGDTYLRAFLKAEKLGVGKFQKPRMIFPRSPRYNLDLATWLKPFEHWLWGYLTGRRLFGGSNTRVVGKGLSPRRRANLLVRKFRAIRDCVCFEVDGKAFEAHTTREQLSWEHKVYLAAYHGDEGLRRLLRHQLRLAGTTQGGWKFSRDGCRASGDFNTGMGNTIVMCVAVVAALKGKCKFDILVDGDNALVFLERSSAEWVSRNFANWVFESCGHEMVLEKPVSYLEGVRFGRSAPVFLGHGLGWTMVREPESVLSNAFASHRWLREPVFARRWCNGVARCELSLARGVPVLQVFALEVLKQTETRKAVPLEALRDYFVVGAWLAGEEAVIPVTRECRLSFERAFGWSPEEQLRVEQSLSRLRVEHATRTLEYPDARSWWSAEPGLVESYWDALI